MFSVIKKKLIDIFDEGIEVLENGDVLIEEVVKDKLPVVGIVFTFRDEYLVRKLVKFLKNISILPFEKKNKIINKLQGKNGKLKEKIVIALDRIDLEEKIDYYSKLVIMFCSEEINESLFYRCCKILENYSYYDLVDFQEKNEYSLDNENDSIKYSMGLLQNVSGKLGSYQRTSVGFELQISHAGRIFIELNKQKC